MSFDSEQPNFPAPMPQADTAPDLAPAPAPDTAPPVEAAPEKKRRSGKARKWIVRVFVTLLILGLGVASTYLTLTTLEWQERADELGEISEDLAVQVAEAEAQAATDRAARDEAIAQLEALKAATSDLANSEANAVDNQQALIDYLDAMTQCSQQRQVIIDVLTDSGLIFEGGKSAAQVERETTASCNELEASIATLKQELGQ